MRGLVAATLLLLLVVICCVDVEAYKCKCSRKSPKISYKDVRKVESKPRYPYCKEKMIFVTMAKGARFKGRQYCLHPKLPTTRHLLKRYKTWREDLRVYVE
ncbi:C-X-C motif chemokine 14 isoform X1 [Rhincodon typus]|uniref:C-X-C motif chemokine 14 isoform X1 n=1 Tax=Rhincodon typus TaxID=259920 RepID=UPI0009A3DC70|nr:C-X-C motif chemokine 14 isoform X1 [Rhincodon typus]